MNQPRNAKIEIGTQHFQLLPEKVAFWEEERLLFCADLHWGREGFLQNLGFAIPETNFDQELQTLTRLMERYEAKELLILGDLIHHPKGLHPELISKLKEWVFRSSNTRIGLIPGNHDRALNRWIEDSGLILHDASVSRGSFFFEHEPTSLPSEGFHWYGHLHPSYRMRGLLRKQKFPCYWIRQGEGFLPAFSELAGGAEIRGRNTTDRVFVIADNRVEEL